MSVSRWPCGEGTRALLTRSNLLAVQLWAMGNYHWYLKQEISPSLAEVSAYTSVTWHPEEPMKLAILTPSE